MESQKYFRSKFYYPWGHLSPYYSSVVMSIIPWCYFLVSGGWCWRHVFHSNMTNKELVIRFFNVLSTTLGHFRTTTLCHICKFTLKKQQHLFSHRKPFLKLNLLNPSIHTYKTKYTYTDIGHKLSKQVSPFNIALVKKKKHIRLGHTGTGDHSIWFIDTKEKYKKGFDRNNVKKKVKWYYTNA